MTREIGSMLKVHNNFRRENGLFKDSKLQTLFTLYDLYRVGKYPFISLLEAGNYHVPHGVFVLVEVC